MENVRRYGAAPYKIALVHGGPGAPGEMAPVARELQSEWGVLEPLQSADMLDGLVTELRQALVKYGDAPVTLAGYSWGAWLSAIVAARYQSIVKKLILISSGPFEEKYAWGIMRTRMARLDDGARKEIISLMESFKNAERVNMNARMLRFGQLISKADSYDPMPHHEEVLEAQFDIFQRLWREAEEFRKSGALLELMKNIQCPVTAIHGDYDPHPAAGVQRPLSAVLHNFRFILLRNCGHTPWIERQGRAAFYRTLRGELPRVE